MENSFMRIYHYCLVETKTRLFFYLTWDSLEFIILLASFSKKAVVFMAKTMSFSMNMTCL